MEWMIAVTGFDWNEGIGWAGSMLFCLCAVPQCIKAYRTKRVHDLSWIFILMWLLGEILFGIYVLVGNVRDIEAKAVGELSFLQVLCSDGMQWPLLANYGFNIVLTSCLAYMKWYYGKRNRPGKSGRTCPICFNS